MSVRLSRANLRHVSLSTLPSPSSTLSSPLVFQGLIRTPWPTYGKTLQPSSAAHKEEKQWFPPGWTLGLTLWHRIPLGRPSRDVYGQIVSAGRGPWKRSSFVAALPWPESILRFLSSNAMSIIEIFYSSGFPHNPHLSANYTPIIVKPALVCQMQFRSENSGFLVWHLMALKFSLPIFKCSKRQSEEALTHGMGWYSWTVATVDY